MTTKPTKAALLYVADGRDKRADDIEDMHGPDSLVDAERFVASLARAAAESLDVDAEGGGRP